MNTYMHMIWNGFEATAVFDDLNVGDGDLTVPRMCARRHRNFCDGVSRHLERMPHCIVMAVVDPDEIHC